MQSQETEYRSQKEKAETTSTNFLYLCLLTPDSCILSLCLTWLMEIM
jgi:hypothetical protein